MTTLEKIGLRFKQARKKLKLTQKQVAEIIGSTQGRYSQIENGKHNVTVKTIEKINNCLKIK